MSRFSRHDQVCHWRGEPCACAIYQHGPTLPERLGTPLPAIKFNGYRDVEVLVLGFGRYPISRAAFATYRFSNSDTEWTSPLMGFEFGPEVTYY